MIKEIKENYNIVSLIISVFIIIFFLFKIFDGDRGLKYNLYFLILLILLIVFLWTATVFFFKKKKYPAEKIFLFFSLGWGAIMQMVLPPFSGTDENAHFLSAYYASYIFSPEQEMEDEEVFVIRESDGEWWKLNVNFPSQYDVLMTPRNWMPVRQNNYIPEENIYFKSWIRYIPAGIGISIARIMHLGMVPTIYLGRMMNLFFFTLVGYYIVKILPNGKAQMISLMSMPLFSQQISSYTYDALSITLSLLFVAQCIKCSDEKYKIKLYDVLIMLISYGFLIPNKGVYSAFGLMIFIIPFCNWKRFVQSLISNRKRKITAVVLTSAGIIVTCGWAIKWFISFFALLNRTGTSIEQFSDIKAYTWDYALSHPMDTLVVLKNTLVYKGWSGVMSMLGQTMGHHRLSIHISTLLLLLVLACIILNIFLSDGKYLRRSIRIWWLVTSVVTVMLIWLGCMIRFTPIDADSLQIAGRYYIPIFSVGLLVFGKDGALNKYNRAILYLQNAFMLCVSCHIIFALVSIQ